MKSQKEAPRLSEGLCYKMRYSWGIPEGFLEDSWGLLDNSYWITGEFLGEPRVFLGGSRGFPNDPYGLPRCFLVLLLLYRKQLGASWELPRSFLGASWELFEGVPGGFFL